MKYAIAYKQEGIANPEFEFDTQAAVAKAWYDRHAGNTSAWDMMIIDEKKEIFTAGCDGTYFLNEGV